MNWNVNNQDSNLPNPDLWYPPSAIIDNDWFPWIKSKMTLNKMLDDKEQRKLYKPIVRKAGSQTRYKIKGSRIIAIIKLAEAGELELKDSDFNEREED